MSRPDRFERLKAFIDEKHEQSAQAVEQLNVLERSTSDPRVRMECAEIRRVRVQVANAWFEAALTAERLARR